MTSQKTPLHGIAGVDEAGRGPMIGPLVVCGVLLENEMIEKLQEIGVKDSKALSPKKRERLAAEIKKFWEDLLPEWQKVDGKIGCAFSSQGGWGGGAELTCQALLTIMINYGFLVFGVTDYSGHQFTAHYGATQAGEPREEKEIESCRRLGKRLAEWVAVYVDGRKDLHPLKGLYKRNPWDK